MDEAKLYYRLFNAITDALEQLEEENLGVAKNILRQAQQQAEEDYISGEDHLETVGVKQ